MDQKTKVIIQEIKYWRKNKLLPEHYCDFLIALYTEGSEYSSRDTLPALKRRLSFKSSKLMIATIVGAILVFYFSFFSDQMQISRDTIFYILSGIGLALGIWYRIFSIQCLSLLLLIATIAWNTQPYFAERFTLGTIEGIGIGISILLLIVSYFIKKLNPKFCVALYVNAIVLLFTPSFQALFMPDIELKTIQIILVIKFVCVLALIRIWHPFRILLKNNT